MSRVARRHVVRRPWSPAAHHRGLIAVLGVLAAAAFVGCCLLGEVVVSVPDFLRVLGGAQLPGTTFIVMDDRLPAAVLAVLVGACFGVSGVLFQTMLRNPLASPDIIGISFGASASAVVAIVLFGLSGAGVAVIACAGAVAVAALIHVLSHGSLAYDHRLVLMGIGVAAVLQAVVSFLLTRADISTASDALVWLTGSLNDADWGAVVRLAIAATLLLPAAGALSRPLGVLGLGEDSAAGLGLNVARTKLLVLMIGVLLSAVATAAAGPVAFVAFLSGPISRRLHRGRVSLTVAALTGILIVLCAQLAGAVIAPEASIPVGVITGVLGAPALVVLVVVAHRQGTGGRHALAA